MNHHSNSPLLKLRGIIKTYPGVRALSGVDLDLAPGEVLALLGENGAGKSTLIKSIGGAISPDGGSIEVEGEALPFNDPHASRDQGIGIIYQEFNLVPAQSVRDNIFLGQDLTRNGFIQAKQESQKVRDLLHQLGLDIDPETLCRNLSVAEQQLVEIAKALLLDAKILILDEPTAALPPHEVDSLLKIVSELRDRGLGIIYVSHRLEEIYRIADRVLILRDGSTVIQCPLDDLSREEMIEHMVGRKLDQEFPQRDRTHQTESDLKLEVNQLGRGRRVKNISFTAKGGEILALAGLVGAGRTETARLLFGADRPERGTATLNGKPLKMKSPRQAIREGVCLLTEDRKAQGLVLGRSVRENFGLPNLPQLSKFSFIQQRIERRLFSDFIDRMKIKVPHSEQLAKNLSGGNQQKVVLSKWLQSESKVLIFDEPTRGIDVGAKYEIYQLMHDLANQGKIILMISSELPEVLGMADRILVLHEGRVAGEVENHPGLTQEDILNLAVGSSVGGDRRSA